LPQKEMEASHEMITFNPHRNHPPIF